MSRQPISQKLRFDVFKRDGFTCQYCGATPPALLEVDFCGICWNWIREGRS